MRPSSPSPKGEGSERSLSYSCFLLSRVGSLAMLLATRRVRRVIISSTRGNSRVPSPEGISIEGGLAE